MKKYHGQFYEFGDSILSKVPGKPEGGRMQPRWISGIWLGKRWGSDEHIVSLPGGKVARARNVKPSAEGFNRELFDELIGRPCDPSGSWDGAGEMPRGVMPQMARVPEGRPEAPVESSKVRATPIQRKYLEQYGFTEGCPKCRAIQRQDETHPTLAHNAACRARIEELLKNDPQFQEKIAAQDARRDRYLAREVERGDESRNTEASKPETPKAPDVLEEDDIPEANEEEVIGRSRASSRDEGTLGTSKEEEEGSDGPDAKRARIMTVGVDKVVLGILVSSLGEVSAVGVGPRKIRGS